MSDEYIKREDALDNIRKIGKVDRWLPAAVSAVKECPSEDVEPVRHGHWIEGAMCIECSRCGEKFSDEIVYMCRPHRKPKRCPECGARMDGGK